MAMGWSWDGPKLGWIWAIPPSCHRTVDLHLVAADADATPNANPDLYLCFQKAPCENRFWAIMNACLASKACDRTGVVAIACVQCGRESRHARRLPHSEPFSNWLSTRRDIISEGLGFCFIHFYLSFYFYFLILHFYFTFSNNNLQTSIFNVTASPFPWLAS